MLDFDPLFETQYKKSAFDRKGTTKQYVSVNCI